MSLRTHRPVAAALNAEMPEHLGHEKHRAEPDRTGSNVRNGTRSKTGRMTILLRSAAAGCGVS
jgi:transposase-like protein